MKVKLTEFERITSEQVAIECGNAKPNEQNIIDAIRIATRCNTNRLNNKLKEL